MSEKKVEFDELEKIFDYYHDGYQCAQVLLLYALEAQGIENPDLIRAMGAEPVVYAMRNECCGGYVTLENPDYAKKQAQRILDNARARGAQCLITACPLCMYNLRVNTDGSLPVHYFTELLARALGVDGKEAADA